MFLDCLPLYCMGARQLICLRIIPWHPAYMGLIYINM